MSEEEDLLDAESEAWKPEVGDKVIGRLVKVTFIEGNYQPYPMYEILTDDGRVIDVHAFHRVLADEIEHLKIREGDRFGIKYLGKPDGKSYELYRVVPFERAATVPTREPVVEPKPARVDENTGEILPPEFSEEPF